MNTITDMAISKDIRIIMKGPMNKVMKIITNNIDIPLLNKCKKAPGKHN
jgi:hypothetical protein